MSDDALRILADAGVECAEAEELWGWPADHFLGSVGFVEQRKAEAAVLALARLATRTKEECPECRTPGGQRLGLALRSSVADTRHDHPQRVTALWTLRGCGPGVI